MIHIIVSYGISVLVSVALFTYYIVGGALVVENAAVNAECSHFGIVPSWCVVHIALFYECLNASVEVSVSDGEYSFTLMVVDKVFYKPLCPLCQLLRIFYAIGEQGVWYSYATDESSCVFAPVAFP